jgi:hypothetical protein
MELDDLRRRWQEQPTTPPSLTPEQTLRAMLSQTDNAPLAQMKRHARRDIRLVLLILFINVFSMIRHEGSASFMAQPVARLILVTLLLVTMGSFVWQFQLIRQMEQVTDNLYQHLRSRIQQFRQLIRVRRYIGFSGLLLLLLTILYIRRDFLSGYLDPNSGELTDHLVVLVIGFALLLTAFTLLLIRGNHVRQRRYGQYLDQMESAVRELEEANRLA